MSDKIIAQRTATAPIEGWGKDAKLTATAMLHQLRGNSRPYFSVTGEVRRPGRSDCEAWGCLHEDILARFPSWAPAIALHLADDDGTPMHALANGWYWMSLAMGSQKYRDAGKSDDDYLVIWAEHVRVTVEEAHIHRSRFMEQGRDAEAAHAAWIAGQGPRWKAEADAVLAWLKQS